MEAPKWLNWNDDEIESLNESSRLYKYTYGVKDIQVRYKEFSKESVFVSKPYAIDGNIIEVSLSAEDENYITHAIQNGINPYDSAIEYYISFKEYPHYNEWIPILPTGCKKVDNEMLLLRGSPKGSLRFACDPTKEIVVYKNNVKLPSEFWSYCADNSIIIEKHYDKYAIYTASYSPAVLVSDPWNVELKAEDRKIVDYRGPDGSFGETFKSGTDRNGCIVLSKYPYVDYARINANDTTYQPISVGLSNANIAGYKTTYKELNNATVPATRNMTDYKSQSEVTLLPYDPALKGNAMTHPYFEFLQDGRKLYFTETFNNSSIISNMPTNHGDAWVNVQYQYLMSQFRFKVILRNTSSRTNSVTPSVGRYSLVFKVMR